MKKITLSVPFHTVQRYLDGVLDPDKGFRTDAEIREIIRTGFDASVGFLPRKVPRNYRHTVELKDPASEESFGNYHLSLWPDEKREYDLVAKTLLETCMS